MARVLVISAFVGGGRPAAGMAVEECGTRSERTQTAGPSYIAMQHRCN
jgi:hypothetical protein